MCVSVCPGARRRRVKRSGAPITYAQQMVEAAVKRKAVHYKPPSPNEMGSPSHATMPVEPIWVWLSLIHI